MGRLFGTDGVRGIANEELNCTLAFKIGCALGQVISANGRYKPKVVIGFDSRISGDMLGAAVSAGLCSLGCEVLLLGVIPTPAVAYLVKKYNAKAGVMISASHNPYNYNGIKIFGEDGYKLSDELEARIEELTLDSFEKISPAPADKIGRIYDARDAERDYLEYLRSLSDFTLDGLKIGIDCANGATSATAYELFNSLGAECHILNATPNGININDRCGSTDLEKLKKFVLENSLDCGIAFDGDGDRCLAVDENANEVDGDYILAILSLKMKEAGLLAKNSVVGTVMSNLGFIKFCEKNGINFIAARVGDRFVLEIMNLESYSLGGEQSGHIIFRDYATTGDGQLSALMLLSYLKKSKSKLSELASVMTKYPQYTVNIEANADEKLLLFTDEDIKTIIESAENKLAGNGRLIVRPSGTEPLIRIMAEGENREETERLAKSVAKEIRNRLDNLKNK